MSLSDTAVRWVVVSGVFISVFHALFDPQPEAMDDANRKEDCSCYQEAP
jgi:hypothetical protein